MTKIESKTVEIKRDIEFVYNFLSSFSNFNSISHEKLENLKVSDDKCSFTVKGMGDFGLKIIARVPNNSITIINDPDVNSSIPMNFILTFNFKSTDYYVCQTTITVELDANPIIAMAVKKPVEKAINTLAEALKTRLEMII